MDIVYLTQHFASPEGTSGARHWWVTNCLSRRGHNVQVITGPGYLPDRVRQKNPRGYVDLGGLASVYVVHAPYSQKMGAWSRLRSFVQYTTGASLRALKLRRSDLLIATSTPLSIAVPALVNWWLRRVPFVFEVRDRWPDGPIELGKIKAPPLKWLLFRLEALAYRNAKKIIALSPGMRDGVIAKGVPADKVVVIPNMADTDSFGPHVDPTPFRLQHDLQDKFVVGYSGAMGFINGCGAILDAANRLKHRPDIVFLLIGDGNERPEMEKRVAAESLSNVRLMRPVPRREVPKVVAAMDVGLMTIRYFKIKEENSANKFFDYLASGTPIVLNYGGWQAQILAEYEAGMTAPPKDPERLAAVIRELADAPERVKKMGRNARYLAEKCFSREMLLARYAETIETTLLRDLPGRCRKAA
jgi:glycosyltransferase involved in cell wall biosynthesis